MKRLTLLLLLLASVSYGQGVRFGARIGFTVADLIIEGRGFDTANVLNSDRRMEYVTDLIYSGHVGGFTEIKLPKRFYIEPGVNLTVLGTEYRNVKLFKAKGDDFESKDFYKRDKVYITQLNLPFWLKYNAVAGLRPKVGAYVGYLASVREKSHGKTTEMDTKYRRTDVDFGLGVGVEYHFSTGLFLDTNFNIGLANLSTRGEVRNFFLQTGVGYKF